MIYLQLFFSYFKIGLFGFGGGYAMLSFIQQEVVEHRHWLSDAQFTDIVAISQVTPGPIGINSATYIGYTVTGNVVGSLVATLAVCLPSFILLWTIARYYLRFRNNPYVEGAMVGLRLTVVGLIAAAALLLMNGANFVDYKSILIFLAVLVAAFFKKIHPILLICLAGAAGLVIY